MLVPYVPPYLIHPVLFYGLLLVQASQSSVMPFVELPRVHDGDVHLKHRTEQDRTEQHSTSIKTRQVRKQLTKENEDM